MTSVWPLRRRRPDDRGSAAVEYVGMLFLVLPVLMAILHFYASFLALEDIEDAARTGARVGSMRGAPEGAAAARASLPGWVGQPVVRVERRGDRIVSRVEGSAPRLIPGFPWSARFQRDIEMPVGG